MKKPLIHCCSKALIKKYGLVAAIIIRFAVSRIDYSQKIMEDKKWYRLTAKKLQENLPYLCKTHLDDTMRKLSKEDDLFHVEIKNLHKYDRSRSYSVHGAGDIGHETDLLYFKVDHAVKYGIVEGILIGNLCYWFQKNRKKKKDYAWHTFSPKEMTKHLPFSEKVLRHALDHLVEKHVLQKQKDPSNKNLKQYRFTEEANFLDGQLSEKCPKPDTALPKPDKRQPVADQQCPKPDERQPKPDNDTIKKKKEESKEEKRERHIDKENPAPPVSGTFRPFSLSGIKKLIPGFKTPEPTAEGGGEKKSPSSNPVISLLTCEVPGITPKSTDYKEFHSWNVKTLESIPETRKCVSKEALEIAESFILSSDSKVLATLGDLGLNECVSETFKLIIENHKVVGSYDEASVQFIYRIATDWVLTSLHYFWDKKSFEVHQLRGTMGWKLSPIWEELRMRDVEDNKKRRAESDLKIEQERQDRNNRYRSPDEHKEGVANLSAAEKMKVLRNSIIAINQRGTWDGHWRNNVIQYNEGSLVLAKKFFSKNPEMTVTHFRDLREACHQECACNPDEPGKKDPLFHARKASDLTFLLRHMDKIVSQMDWSDHLPATIAYLTGDDWQKGKSKKTFEES